MSLTLDPPTVHTFQDLQESLGGVSARRIVLSPAPGTATLADAERLGNAHDRRYELIDGTLVEKPMAWKESLICGTLHRKLGVYLEANDCGVTTGEQGGLRLRPGRLRYPDLAFYRYERFPGGTLPAGAFPDIAPDLAIEVLSESNTPKEMELKRIDYFAAGTRLVWEIDPGARTVEVFTGPEESTQLTVADELHGGETLPGFVVPVRDLFDKLDRMAATNG